MRYLNNRDKFIKEYKSLNEAFDMSGSGPMGNDINWGDSLLGRLVNSIRRVVGVQASLNRISRVIKELKNIFDDIINNSSAKGLSDEQKKKIGMVLIYEIIRMIEIAIYDKKQKGFTGDSDELGISIIKDEEYLEEIETCIITYIEEIGKIADDYGVENETEIVSYLNELLEKVKDMKKNLKSEEESEETIEEPTKDLEKKANLIFVENFRTVADIYETYKNLKDEQKVKMEPEYKDAGKVEVSESLLLENKGNVLASIKSLYNVINSEGGEEASNDIKNIKSLPKGQVIQVSTMNRLYRNIIRLIGTKNEKLEVLLGKESLAKAIANLYINTRNITSQALNELPDFKDSILNFNKTMEDCLNDNLYKPVVEKRLLRYSSFIKEDKRLFMDYGSERDDKNTQKVTLETQQPILKQYWKELLEKGLSRYILTIEEARGINKEFENLDIDDDSDALVIKGGETGIDPIIEIIRIFNRAYKLHTFPVIPGGRSGGRVTNQTFRNYTSFGDGKPETAGASGGPYRNNRLFNKWENGVLEIMKDTEYQPIFNKNTVIIIDGDKRKGVGPALSKFMIDMLDGDTLYQSSSRGYGDKKGGIQKTFLLKYFSDIIDTKKIEKLDEKGLSLPGSNDAENNQKLADKIENLDISIKKDKTNITKEDLKRTFFLSKGIVKNKDGEQTEETIYFHIQQILNNHVIVVYSKSFDKFNDLIRNNFKGKNITFDDKIKRSLFTKKLLISKFEHGVIEKIRKGEEFIKLKGNEKDKSYVEDNDILFKPKTGEFGWLYLYNESKLLSIDDDKYLKNWPIKVGDTTGITKKG